MTINARPAMAAGARSINVARGRLGDERALLRALRDGLSVARCWTRSTTASARDVVLLRSPNVIVTPHTAVQRRVLIAASSSSDNLRRSAVGEPLLNVVIRSPATD
jgi:glyoxylate/hydroxypyruvate reductase A